MLTCSLIPYAENNRMIYMYFLNVKRHTKMEGKIFEQ